MTDYSDLINLTFAIALFSVHILSVNRSIVVGEVNQTNNTVEYYGITLVQEMVDQVRWKNDETEFLDYADEFPKYLDYHVDSDNNEKIEFLVDMDVTNHTLSNSEVNVYDVLINVKSEYLHEGNDGKGLGMKITKTFIK
jgi:hypothetical protein